MNNINLFELNKIFFVNHLDVDFLVSAQMLRVAYENLCFWQFTLSFFFGMT